MRGVWRLARLVHDKYWLWCRHHDGRRRIWPQLHYRRGIIVFAAAVFILEVGDDDRSGHQSGTPVHGMAFCRQSKVTIRPILSLAEITITPFPGSNKYDPRN